MESRSRFFIQGMTRVDWMEEGPSMALAHMTRLRLIQQALGSSFFNVESSQGYREAR